VEEEEEEEKITQNPLSALSEYKVAAITRSAGFILSLPQTRAAALRELAYLLRRTEHHRALSRND
jgi:hypothetical protein